MIAPSLLPSFRTGLKSLMSLGWRLDKGQTMETESSRNHVPLRILVVEDDEDSAELLAVLLRDVRGHEVTLSKTGEEALEALSTSDPNLIFVDISLPEMDGYEVARQIRSRYGADHCTLMALSGYGRDEDRDLSRQAGFYRHLVKPVTADMLDSALGEASFH